MILFVAYTKLIFQRSQGTIMPWEPTNELIVEGIYRYLRNPMHIGVGFILLGQGLILTSVSIMVFIALGFIVHVFYLPLIEERHREERFGDEYRNYRQNVPRWMPRLTPWEPED